MSYITNVHCVTLSVCYLYLGSEYHYYSCTQISQLHRKYKLHLCSYNAPLLNEVKLQLRQATCAQQRSCNTLCIIMLLFTFPYSLSVEKIFECPSESLTVEFTQKCEVN